MVPSGFWAHSNYTVLLLALFLRRLWYPGGEWVDSIDCVTLVKNVLVPAPGTMDEGFVEEFWRMIGSEFCVVKRKRERVSFRFLDRRNRLGDKNLLRFGDPCANWRF